ncbi:MAG: hypothetical protein FJZ97_10535, partial [Chloroflexi bacterium]|nr:hypothetical protein [Chloroflexota bacterium]
SLPRIRQVVSQVGDALNYAHGRGLVHRDVKPSNVLIDEGGNCLLTDFGLARMVEASVNLTATGTIMGTPAYMSPEQGAGHKTDSRSDIYSLGIILYEMATGRVPYRAETPVAVVFMHVSGPLPLPRSLNPDLPEAVERVILKALAKNPDDRYQTAEALVAALRQAIPEAPRPEGKATARTESKPKQARAALSPTLGALPDAEVVAPPAPRRRVPGWAWAVIVLGVGLVGSLAAGGIFLANRPVGASAPAPSPVSTRTEAIGVPPTSKAAPTLPPVERPVSFLRLAILAPLSGPVPTFGVSTRDGALLAIDEWNAKGGVLGMQIEAIVEDSQCSADPAVAAANKVIDVDGVHYIVGEVCSKASIPVSEIAEAKAVIQISPTSTNVAVTLNADGTTKKHVFRACFIDPFQGAVAAAFAEKQGFKTAFIMFDQGNDYVRGLAEAFEGAYTAAGGTIVGKESYTATDTDFSAILAKVANANPDVVYLPDYYNIVNLVTAQAKEKGITAPFMGGDGWDSADLNKEAASGGFYTNHYSEQDSRPIVAAFATAYGAKYQDDTGAARVPDALAALAYDATNLLLAAIEKAGADDAAKVAAAMEALSYDAVSGRITFDAQHNPIKAAVVLQVQPDKIVWVDTVAP